MRKQQCRMACGGEAAGAGANGVAGVLARALASGSEGSAYSAVRMAAATIGAAATSALCWPKRQCSAHRLGDWLSIERSSEGALETPSGMFIRAGQAWLATLN